MSGEFFIPRSFYVKYKKHPNYFNWMLFMYIYHSIYFIAIYNKLKITIHDQTYAFRSILEKNVTIKIKTIAPNNAGRTKIPPHSGPQ